MGNNTLKLSQACEGMLRYRAATGKSPHTIVDYRSSFKKLQLYFSSDPPFASISREQLIAFFAWLQDEYVSEPDGAAPRGHDQQTLDCVSRSSHHFNPARHRLPRLRVVRHSPGRPWQPGFGDDTAPCCADWKSACRRLDRTAIEGHPRRVCRHRPRHEKSSRCC